MHAANLCTQAYFWAICLLAFAVSLPFTCGAAGVWLVAFTWLLSGGYRHVISHWKTTPAFWMWAAYYILFAAGYFYCRDKQQSVFDSTQKLSFILLPLLIGSGPVLKELWLSRIFTSFIAGLGIVSILLLTQAARLWLSDGNIWHLFYHSLVNGVDANAVYMSWYVLFALCILLFYPLQTFLCRSWIRGATFALLTLFFILLSCRLLLVIFLLFILPLWLFRLNRKKTFTTLRKSIIGSVVVVALLLLSLTHNPLRQRFQDVLSKNVSEAFETDYKEKPQPDGNLTIRLFLWRIGIENVAVYNLWLRGAGNGDAHLLINERIASKGIRGMTEAEHYSSNLYNVNLHNMYLQSLLMVGLPGMILFILIVFLPLFYLKRTHCPVLWLCFNLISAAFFLQEAALQTQAGIIFYVLFNVLFWRLVKSAKIERSSATMLPDY